MPHIEIPLRTSRAGGAKLKLPMIALFVGSMALMGFFPFAGFYSKDAILEHLFVEGDWVLFGMALLGVFVTAYYTARAIYLMLKVLLPTATRSRQRSRPRFAFGWLDETPTQFSCICVPRCGKCRLWKAHNWFVIPRKPSMAMPR